jgi:hypothetical protein
LHEKLLHVVVLILISNSCFRDFQNFQIVNFKIFEQGSILALWKNSENGGILGTNLDKNWDNSEILLRFRVNAGIKSIGFYSIRFICSQFREDMRHLRLKFQFQACFSPIIYFFPRSFRTLRSDSSIRFILMIQKTSVVDISAFQLVKSLHYDVYLLSYFCPDILKPWKS